MKSEIIVRENRIWKVFVFSEQVFVFSVGNEWR